MFRTASAVLPAFVGSAPPFMAGVKPTLPPERDKDSRIAPEAIRCRWTETPGRPGEAETLNA
ncbi:hypothetical protein BJF79_05035 [Actinomadura sp. CNU-125]|nr:hypothetical protein BJF79_05035 [Actinomadura sp. CNU-125]